MRLFVLFSILICHFSYGQDCSNDSLLNRFKSDIQFRMLPEDKIVRWDDETRISYYSLMIECPEECLIKYVEDTMPYIRAVVFAGLVMKNTDNAIIEEILKNHRSDTAEVLEMSTDVVISLTVIEYMEIAVNWKAENSLTNEEGYYESRLEYLQNGIRNTPRVIVPGEYRGRISKEALLLVDSITCSHKEVKIISFSMVTVNNIYDLKDSFTEEMKEEIRTMEVGDHISIDTIVAEFPDGTVRQISPVFLTIR
jgi:hypothetical protein